MARKATGQQTLLTTDDVAQWLNVDNSTVRRWVRQGLLEAVFLPHAGKRLGYRFKPETIEALLGNHAESERA